MQELLSTRYDVTVFSGVEISPDDIVDSTPDLLIVDLRLDRRDLQGWDIVELARAHEHLRKIPIVVCSADLGELQTRERAVLDAGNTTMLSKPFSMDTVEGIVSLGLLHGFAHDQVAAGG